MSASYLERALDALVAGVAAPEPDARDARQLAVAAFAANERLDQARASELADLALRALTPDSDAVTRLTAYGARVFAASCDLVAGSWTDIAPGLTPSGDPLVDGRVLLEQLGGGADADFARYLFAESALTCARVAFAAELPIPDGRDFLARAGRPHPFGVVFSVLAARIAAFNGRVAEAQGLLVGVESDAPLLALLVDATRSLVLGNAADPVHPRALAERVERESPRADSRIAAGCYLLAAYGLVAIDEVRDAVRFLLAAGGDADLDRLMICDRAIGFETLVNAALTDGDPDAAESWAARGEPLARSPIADATVERIHSRILLSHGDADAALAAADRAGERARAEGRVIEASEAGILAARAGIAAKAGGAAGRRLQSLAEEAQLTGHRAVIRAANQELRVAGRRLRPLAGTEWSGLSKREREVALLLLEGRTNLDIASALYLSPHTVRVHVSRVLAAFGAASRFALAAKVPAARPAAASSAALTSRQRAVVAELATGASNAEMAARLGISVKTVEKHLHEVMGRLGVTNRVGVLRATVGASTPVE